MRQIKKNTYSLLWGAREVTITVKGSFLTGVALLLPQEEIWIISKATWYDWALSILPFILILVWGNNVRLCSIIPVVGGAIGGFIGGVGIIVTRILSCDKSFLRKLVTALLMTAATFGVGAAVGFAIMFALL